METRYVFVLLVIGTVVIDVSRASLKIKSVQQNIQDISKKCDDAFETLELELEKNASQLETYFLNSNEELASKKLADAFTKENDKNKGGILSCIIRQQEQDEKEKNSVIENIKKEITEVHKIGKTEISDARKTYAEEFGLHNQTVGGMIDYCKDKTKEKVCQAKLKLELKNVEETTKKCQKDYEKIKEKNEDLLNTCQNKLWRRVTKFKKTHEEKIFVCINNLSKT